MRTTLTLDDDVAALLNQVRQMRKTGLKETVNEALRNGLVEMTKPPRKQEPYRTIPVDLGPCALPNVDNVAEVIAWAEGEDYK